jgi:DNA-binding beta-propeller fold protein YncE
MKKSGRKLGQFGLLGIFCSLVLTMFGATGCARQQGELFPALAEPLSWPEPPEQARIAYVGAISTEADLKRGVSWVEGLGQVLFGREEIGILVDPYAVAVDDDERLFVADGAGGVIHSFDLVTREYAQFSAIESGGLLQMPVAITFVEGSLYVVDSLLHKVCVFDRNGRFLFSFGSEELERPSGIAFSRVTERLYVVDTGRHVVTAYDKRGVYLSEIGSRGTSAGQFNFPTHAWIGSGGRLHVSDTLNYRVQVFDGTENFLYQFGSQGDRPGNFAHPCGVATDTFGHIYVADRQFENIQIFDSYGRILMALGEEGTAPGEFWLPAGMFIDGRNRIYVADSFNKRVQIFELINTGER